MRKAEAIRLLTAHAKAHGAHVEDDSTDRQITIQLCAPEGKFWVETSGPHLVVTTMRGPQAWLDDAVKDGIERMRSGLYDQDDED